MAWRCAILFEQQMARYSPNMVKKKMGVILPLKRLGKILVKVTKKNI